MNSKNIIIGVSLLVVFVLTLFMFSQNKSPSNNSQKESTPPPSTTDEQQPNTGVLLRQDDDSIVPCIGMDCFYLLE